MYNHKELTDYINDIVVHTILVLSDTTISESAFINASTNINIYGQEQIEKCGWYKNSPHCLAKIKAVTKAHLELIIVSSDLIKDEDALQRTVRILEKSMIRIELEK